jgi:hypothetical protein
MAIRRLRDVSDGLRIFVDTNILVYHLLEDELYGASCRDFLNRVETGSVVASLTASPKLEGKAH